MNAAVAQMLFRASDCDAAKNMTATIPDWITAIGTLAAGGAAVAAAYQGIRSLNAWRSEAIGRREFEVAEQTLTTFYRLREIIQQSRSPFVPAGEQVDEEGNKISPSLVPLHRFWRHADEIAKFRLQRHSFLALFGPKEQKCFNEVEKVIGEFTSACDTLAAFDSSSDDLSFQKELRESCWRLSNDNLGERLDAAVDEIEQFCRSKIEASQAR